MGQINNRRIALIPRGKKQLALDEDAYRSILSCAGVESAADIMTDAQFNIIMNTFSDLGLFQTRFGTALIPPPVAGAAPLISAGGRSIT
ncbi:MAG: regulatory protein GemA [Treponema sp.]|jgi:hypothetical protein|nr:regulatory protein GemA [Treponema sp.]